MLYEVKYLAWIAGRDNLPLDASETVVSDGLDYLLVTVSDWVKRQYERYQTVVRVYSITPVAPYACSECGIGLEFPQVFYFEGLPYCSKHLPAYSRESEEW